MNLDSQERREALLRFAQLKCDTITGERSPIYYHISFCHAPTVLKLTPRTRAIERERERDYRGS